MILEYIFIALIFFIAILVFSKSSKSSSFDKYTAIFTTIVLAFVIFNFPSTKDYKHFDLWREETSQANLLTIEKIQSYHLKDTVHILENEGGMNLFLGETTRSVMCRVLLNVLFCVCFRRLFPFYVFFHLSLSISLLSAPIIILKIFHGCAQLC